MTIPRWLLMFLSLCLKITNKWPVDSTKVIYNKMKEVNVRHSLNESMSRRWWCERIRHKKENKIKRRNTPKRETSWEKSSSERRDHEKWKYAFLLKERNRTVHCIVCPERFGDRCRQRSQWHKNLHHRPTNSKKEKHHQAPEKRTQRRDSINIQVDSQNIEEEEGFLSDQFFSLFFSDDHEKDIIHDDLPSFWSESRAESWFRSGVGLQQHQSSEQKETGIKIYFSFNFFERHELRNLRNRILKQLLLGQKSKHTRKDWESNSCPSRLDMSR